MAFIPKALGAQRFVRDIDGCIVDTRNKDFIAEDQVLDLLNHLSVQLDVVTHSRRALADRADELERQLFNSQAARALLAMGRADNEGSSG